MPCTPHSYTATILFFITFVLNATARWSEIRRIVSGRVIIGHATGDWLLRFLFRGSSAEVSGDLLVSFPLKSAENIFTLIA